MDLFSEESAIFESFVFSSGLSVEFDFLVSSSFTADVFSLEVRVSDFVSDPFVTFVSEPSVNLSAAGWGEFEGGVPFKEELFVVVFAPAVTVEDLVTADMADAVTVFPAMVTSLAPVPPLLIGMVFMMLDCDVPG